MKLNLGDVESRVYEDLKPGPYHVALTDGEVRYTSAESQHPENPFWNLEFTIQDGEYEGRKMWTNAMLPPYDPFTVKNILKASGRFTDDELDQDLDVELIPEEADNDDTIVLLDEDDPLEMIAVWGKNRKSKQMEIRRFQQFDPDNWDAEGDGNELP